MKFPLTYEQVQMVLEDDYSFLDGELYDQLYNYYLPQMPYGTAKARTGDPDQFIYEQIIKDFTAVNEYVFQELYQ